MRRIATLIFLFVFLSLSIYAQNKIDSVKSPKTYWLKYSLIFFQGCKPMVLPKNIIFTEGNCSTNPYNGKILPRGTEVKISSIDRKKKLANVTFSDEAATYEVLLNNTSKQSFRKSFNLLFTRKKREEFYETKCPEGDIKTKKQLIQCLGFPITVTRKEGFEEYHYIIEFTGRAYIDSYDGFTFKIKNGKIIELSGYI